MSGSWNGTPMLVYVYPMAMVQTVLLGVMFVITVWGLVLRYREIRNLRVVIKELQRNPVPVFYGDDGELYRDVGVVKVVKK